MRGSWACAAMSSLPGFLAVHVGAGSHSAAKEPAYKEAMRAACKAGLGVLTSGSTDSHTCASATDGAAAAAGAAATGMHGDSQWTPPAWMPLEAVQEAIRVLEVSRAWRRRGLCLMKYALFADKFQFQLAMILPACPAGCPLHQCGDRLQPDLVRQGRVSDMPLRASSS